MAKVTFNPAWIDEKTASELLGLSVATLKRQVKDGSLLVRYSKVSRNAKPRFNRYDIEILLEQSVIIPVSHLSNEVQNFLKEQKGQKLR